MVRLNLYFQVAAIAPIVRHGVESAYKITREIDIILTP